MSLRRFTTMVTLAAIVAPLILSILVPAALAPAEAAPSVNKRFGAVEAYRATDAARDARIGWERVIFSWKDIQPASASDWNGGYLPPHLLDQAIADGRDVVGLLIATPRWASDGGRAVDVPRGLYLPADDPNNVWAAFVRRIVADQRGRITTWIIWNEPDIWNPADGGYQWAGSVEDYYQLVKIATIAARSVDPSIRISLAGLTHWWDAQYGKSSYIDRFLKVASADPTARQNGWYFDVVALQLYNDPIGVYDIPVHTRGILRKHGLERPIWINETNVAPWDDPVAPLSRDAFRATQQEQASYIIQASAAALAAGAERVSFYKMRDEPVYNSGTEPWGLLRSDGSARPAYDAVKVVTEHFDHTERADLRRQGSVITVTLVKATETVYVVWNTSASPTTAVVPAHAPTATIIDRVGSRTTVSSSGGVFRLPLPGASHTSAPGQPRRVLTGGGPLLLIQAGAPRDGQPAAQAPVAKPASSAVEPHWTAPTGKTVSGDWLAHLKASGDVDTHGYPISSVGEDPTTGQTVQCFQRSILEYHPSLAPEFRIQRRLLADLVYPGADPPVANSEAPPGPSRYFAVSANAPTGLGHFVANYTASGQWTGFLEFFDQRGGVKAFGFPKEEPKVRDGRLTQRFQAAVFEYHPEFDRDGLVPGSAVPLRNYRVQLELIGDRYTKATAACPAQP